MKKWLMVIPVVLLAVGAWFGALKWRDHVSRRHDAALYQNASALLAAGRAADAAAVIHTRLPYAHASDETVRRWRELQVAVSARMHQTAQLLAIDERWPDAVAGNEDASLLVARARLDGGHRAETRQLADRWLPKSARPQLWFVLEADTLLAEKKTDNAVALLKSRSFPGPADCVRLARLALLSQDDLRAAWNYLADAYRLDPHNPDVRSFRAQILERIGKVPLARVEYVAAQQADPSSLLLRDQLAEYYARNGRLSDALDVWTGDPSQPMYDYMWVKTWFWSRVARPVKLVAARGDELNSLVKLMQALPKERFWNGEEFARIADAKRYGHQQQETFWLGLLELLRTHDDKGAAETLRHSRIDAHPWQPDLELALRRVLSYRLDGVLNARHQPASELSGPKETLHPLFVALDDLAQAEREGHLVMPPEMDRLLRGDAAFAAAMLAAGWSEAALRLRPPDDNGDGLPSWYAYGITQALRLNRGDAPAIAFAQRQRLTPELSLLLGETQLADGKTDEAVPRLTPLAAQDSDVGFRAAWLLCLSALYRHQPAEAARLVQAQRRLAESNTGREILARVALAEGHLDEADKNYAAISADSAEAKTFLARRAYARKDWKDARRYTNELLILFPDQLQLRANLEAIDRAEHTGS